jgi:hypothetical protein
MALGHVPTTAFEANYGPGVGSKTGKKWPVIAQNRPISKSTTKTTITRALHEFPTNFSLEQQEPTRYRGCGN